MGFKCNYCGYDNGVTMFFGKRCRRCGERLSLEEEDIPKEIPEND